jgi:hypothetical protein
MRPAQPGAGPPCSSEGLRVRRISTMTMMVLLGTLLTGCLAHATAQPGLSKAQLSQLPEAQLIYPGAVVLGRGGQDGETGALATTPSLCWPLTPSGLIF